MFHPCVWTALYCGKKDQHGHTNEEDQHGHTNEEDQHGHTNEEDQHGHTNEEDQHARSHQCRFSQEVTSDHNSKSSHADTDSKFTDSLK